MILKVHARYTRGLFEPHFQISGELVKSDGIKYFAEERSFEIPHFAGTLFFRCVLSLSTYQQTTIELIDIDDLPVKPMTRSIFEQLTARGKIFEQVALGNHYKNYERFIFYQHAAFRVHYTKVFSWLHHQSCLDELGNSYSSTLQADGRVMVDVATFNRMNPSYKEFGVSAHMDATQQQNLNIRNQLYNQGNPNYYQQQQQRMMLQQQLAASNAGGFSQQLSLTDENLYKTWPTVAGFSFAAKAWGEIVITYV